MFIQRTENTPRMSKHICCQMSVNSTARYFGWGDGTSRNDVSDYLGPLVPQMNRFGNTMSCIDTFLSFCINQYILYSAQLQGCINAGTLCHQGRLIWGPGVPENSNGDTSFQDVQLRHHILFQNVCLLGLFIKVDNLPFY